MRILIKNLKTGERSTPTRKTKIWSNLRHEIEKDGHIYIRVTYAPGFYNDGEFDNYRDARRAMRAFTEKELLNEF